MLLWHKELSKREKIKRLLNLPFSKKLPKKRPIERLQKPKRRLKLRLREFMSKNLNWLKRKESEKKKKTKKKLKPS